jgi:hypothetical protein
LDLFVSFPKGHPLFPAGNRGVIENASLEKLRRYKTIRLLYLLKSVYSVGKETSANRTVCVLQLP